MIRSRTRSSSLNRTAELSSVRASPLRTPRTSRPRHVPKLLSRLPRGEHDAHRLGQQSPSDERQRQRRGMIQPLGVVDDTHHGTFLRYLREQAQRSQADEEPIRRCPGTEPEHRFQGRRWGAGASRARRAAARTADAGSRTPAPSPTPPLPPAAPSSQTPTRSDTPAAPSSDPGLPRQQQRPTLAAADALHHRIQRGAFISASEQGRAPPRFGNTILHRTDAS